MYNQLGALSPLDGRYSNSVKELNGFFSEAAIMRYRIYIEVEYLIALSFEKKIEEFPALTKEQIEDLEKYIEILVWNLQITLKKLSRKRITM